MRTTLAMGALALALTAPGVAAAASDDADDNAQGGRHGGGREAAHHPRADGAGNEQGTAGHRRGGGHHHRTVRTCVLRGSLSAFVAAADGTPGTVSIAVTSANRAGRSAVGTTLTFPLSVTTRVVGSSPIADGDSGTVRLRAASCADVPSLATVVPAAVVDRAGDE